MTPSFEDTSTDLHLSVTEHLNSLHLLFHKQQLLSIKLLAEQVIHSLSAEEFTELHEQVESLINSITTNIESHQFGEIVKNASDVQDMIDLSASYYPIIQDLHSYLTIYLKMIGRESTSFQEQVQFNDLSGIDTVQAYQQIIDPLSNQKRLDIMLAIQHKQKRFKELEKDLDLQAGHLIYHLNPLKEGDYVRQDGQKNYYLSEKGITILKAIQQIYNTYVD